MKRTMLILLVTLLGAISCHHEEMPSGGSLRIVFETGALQTKADPDGNVADGGGIFINSGTPDLVLLIAREDDGEIVATYPGSGHLEGDPNVTTVAVSFSSLPGGFTYTVYAFANTEGLWTMKNGETTVTNLTTLGSASDVENLMFRPVSEDLNPDGSLKVLESRLPLSAKGSVTLSELGNGEVSLQLLRCVAKVTAVFENQYGKNLTLTSFSNTFYHMNPGTSYVVPHANDFPVEQEDANDGNITATLASLSIADNGTYSTSWYVFPSIGPYTCDVIFTMDALEHRYTNLPVTDDHARDITQLARNQHLTITTRIGKGKKVSFNFEVQDWGEKTERVTFN